ncbi:MAG: FtsX-like permease family protein [Planctomycetota bacterium]
MRAAWRLATKGLSARPSRSLLLIGAVTLSAALISAVACALESAGGAIEKQLESQLGSAEIRVKARGSGGLFDSALLDQVEAWPGVLASLPRIRSSVSVQLPKQALTPVEDGSGFVRRQSVLAASGYGNGVSIESEFATRPVTLIAGRLPETDGEVLVDALMAERLTQQWIDNRLTDDSKDPAGVKVGYLEVERPEVPDRVETIEQRDRIHSAIGVRPGDELFVVRQLSLPVSADSLAKFGISENMMAAFARFFRRAERVTVVGITEPPPLGGVPQMTMSVATLELVTGTRGVLDQIEIDLDDELDPEAVSEEMQAALGETVLVQPTEIVTSQLDKNLESNQVGFLLASILAMLSAAFIIMTGLTTGIAEQQRALAVLRCIGAHKAQLAQSQIITGLLVGGVGAIVGVPLGVGFAWLMTTIFAEQLPTGLRIPPTMLAISFLGAVGAGLVGALWPAWQVVRVSPLKALTGRSQPTKRAAIWRVFIFALLGLATQAAIIGLAGPNYIFWGYAIVGLPAMFFGYFLLAVPATSALAAGVSGAISFALRLPPNLLGRTVRATPFRHGFTAGAMMTGLALMVSIWTNGNSVLNDWLDNIQFPDAFVNGLRLSPQAQDKLDSLPWITNTCAITLHPVETDAFGVTGLSSYKTSFVAFEPKPFFEMSNMEFVEGDRATAERRLEEGGAIIVGKEFRTAKGLGVGDMFTCRDDGAEHTFEIVGVVTSPGLELASKFFNIGEEYIDQAIHAVFGSRTDLREKFGSDSTQLIQISFDEDEMIRRARADGSEDADKWAVAEIREQLFGLGVLGVGSGRRIKARIFEFIGGSLVVFSAVAVASMLVACFGVANLIVAGIEARQFEFGVLRAVGGHRGMLVRLIIGEALLIGITASIVGTLMGIQGSWAGAKLYEVVVGVSVNPFPPPLMPIAVGWGVVLLFTIGAAIPAILRLNGRKTRELLAAAKG